MNCELHPFYVPRSILSYSAVCPGYVWGSFTITLETGSELGDAVLHFMIAVGKSFAFAV